MNYKSGILVLGLCGGILSAPAFAAGDKPTSTGTTGSTSGTMGSQANNPSGQVTTPPVMTVEVWRVYLDQIEKDLASVTFSKNSTALSAAERNRVSEMAPTYARDKNIEKIIVAAWSDEPYPEKEGERLAESARELAEKRADVIEEILEKGGIADVETYSMAEKPNWFQKAFNFDSAQIKGAAENTGTDNLDEDRIQKMLNAKGGPSKAVIIVKRHMQNRQANL